MRLTLLFTVAAIVAVGVLLVALGRGEPDEVQAPAAPGASRTARQVTPRIQPDQVGEHGDLFVDVTSEAGIDFVHVIGDGLMDNVIESVGCGATWFDSDGDGLLDLYLVNQTWIEGVGSATGARDRGRNRLFRNLGDGTFEDVTDAAGVGHEGYSFSAAAADVDGDGDQDLYVLAMGANRLYRNRGDGTYEDRTAQAGLTCPQCSTSGVFLDHDGDGDLDLYVGNYLTYDSGYALHYAPDVHAPPLAYAAQADCLYRNDGDGTFTDVSEAAGLDQPSGRAMGVLAADLDNDGHCDIFVANDMSANFLLRNQGDGRFAEVAEDAGVAYGITGEATGAMAGALGDFDADGLPDIHLTDTSYGSLYQNLGGGLFADSIVSAHVAAPSGQWTSWGGGFLDHDDDGDLDLFIVNGDVHRSTGRPDLLLANDGSGAFADISLQAGAYFRSELPGRGAAIADYDNDGDLDVLVTTIGDRPVLLRNQGTPGAHWITIDLAATRGHPDAYGAVVTVECAGLRQVQRIQAPSAYLSQGDPRLHFGLGASPSDLRVTVAWPDGSSGTFTDLPLDRIHWLVQGSGGE